MKTWHLFTLFGVIFSTPLTISADIIPTNDVRESDVDCCEKKSSSIFKGIRLLIGPEVYNVRRRKDGGTKQNGWMAGGRFLCDYHRRCAIYWALEGSYAYGILNGRTGAHKKLKSHMQDASIEVRAGYTFCSKSRCWAMLSPFIGLGYIWEGNNFHSPSPMHLHYMIKYAYATVGFAASVNATTCLNVGVNLKLRYILNPRCHVSHDPEFSDDNLRVGNDQILYRVELPITYLSDSCWKLTAEPFYERRFYGKQAAYPHDFVGTRLSLVGITLFAGYSF